MEQFLDVCEACESRELEFVLFDLKDEEIGSWLKDIPGYRCRDCGEILVSAGVVEVLDLVRVMPDKTIMFPILRYQNQVLKQRGIERALSERLLHSWIAIQTDGRGKWAYMGARSFGNPNQLTAI